MVHIFKRTNKTYVVGYCFVFVWVFFGGRGVVVLGFFCNKLKLIDMNDIFSYAIKTKIK